MYNNDEIDILKLLRQLFTPRHIVVILIVGVLVASATYAYSKFVIPEKYTSVVSIYVSGRDVALSGDSVELNDVNTSEKLADACVIILKDNIVMQDIGKKLLETYDPETLGKYLPVTQVGDQYTVDVRAISKCISLSSVNDTGVLEVSVVTLNPKLSTDICAYMAEEAPEVLKRVLGAGNYNAIGQAEYPREKSSPNVKLNTVKGFVLGALIPILLFGIKILLNNTISNADDFKENFDFPVLGEIPIFSESDEDK